MTAPEAVRRLYEKIKEAQAAPALYRGIVVANEDEWSAIEHWLEAVLAEPGDDPSEPPEPRNFPCVFCDFPFADLARLERAICEAIHVDHKWPTSGCGEAMLEAPRLVHALTGLAPSGKGQAGQDATRERSGESPLLASPAVPPVVPERVRATTGPSAELDHADMVAFYEAKAVVPEEPRQPSTKAVHEAWKIAPVTNSLLPISDVREMLAAAYAIDFPAPVALSPARAVEIALALAENEHVNAAMYAYRMAPIVDQVEVIRAYKAALVEVVSRVFLATSKGD